jgi:hypothetical protein
VRCSTVSQRTDRQHAGDELATQHLDTHDLRSLARSPFCALLGPPFVALLGDLVGHVFLLRAEKEMVGIYAGADIAAVADQQAIRDRAPMGKP